MEQPNILNKEPESFYSSSLITRLLVYEIIMACVETYNKLTHKENEFDSGENIISSISGNTCFFCILLLSVCMFCFYSFSAHT